MRKQAVLNANRLDSLTISYNQSLNQLNSIKKVLTGDIEFEEFKEREFKLDTGNIDVKLNSKKIIEDSLLRRVVEQEEKYNFINDSNRDENFLFFPPFQGISPKNLIHQKNILLLILLRTGMILSDRLLMEL